MYFYREISRTVLRLTIAQLHGRVIEMAFECFEKFRQDKNLDSWHVRVMEATATADDGTSSLSITALDFLLSQMSAMCDIVQQYYKFLYRTLMSIDVDMIALDTLQQGGGEGRLEMVGAGALIADTDDNIEKENKRNELATAVHIELIVTAQERNRWRELDAVYIALEFGYLSTAINDALSEPFLLEVEEVGFYFSD